MLTIYTKHGFLTFVILGRNGKQNKGGGAKNYQAFIAGKKPDPKPVEGPKVRPMNTKT